MRVVLVLQLLVLISKNIVYAIDDSVTQESKSDCGCSGNGLTRDSVTTSIKEDRNLLSEEVSGEEVSGEPIEKIKKTVQDQINEFNVQMVFIAGGDSFVGTDKPIM